MTMPDPWATPAEEVQAPPPAPVATISPVSSAAVQGSGLQARDLSGAFTTLVSPAVQTPEGKLTLTFKGTGTYADRWLVAHVADPAEGLALLNDPQFKELLDLSKKIAAYDAAAGAAPAAPAAQAAPQRQLQPGQPAGSIEAPVWAPEKPEYDYVYKTGVAKSSGKTWHAWMPPSKDDPRPAKFFYPPR